MIDKIRNYSPYVYVCRRTSGGYTIYILVPVEAGKTIDFPLLDTSRPSNKEKIIRATVVSDASNGNSLGDQENGRYASKFYELDALTELEKLTIFVENGTSQSKKVCWLSDVEDTEATQVNNLAVNCPYTYLVKKNGVFYPRVLIAVFDKLYDSNNESMTPDDKGNYVYRVILDDSDVTQVGDIVPHIVAPDLINNGAYVPPFNSWDCRVITETAFESAGDNNSNGTCSRTNGADADED